MLLENKWHKRIENQGRSIRPPVPPRRTESASVLELLSLYRSSMISVFSEPDFYRDIIHARFGWLDVYTLNTPELVREALQQNHKSLQAKTPQMRMALKPLLGDGLFISDRKIWETRRNIVGPIIHARNIKNFLPVMLEVVHEWRQNLQALGENAKIDMLSEMAELTAEVIARTVFGRRLGREYTAEIVKGFAEYQEHVDQLDYLSLIKAPDWIPRYQSRSAKRALRRVHRVIDLVVQEFAEGRGDENAVIADLFKAKDPAGKALTREAIRNEAIVIFMAGHETTANTLAWAWFLLSQCPRVREKFHKELDAQGLPETIEDVQKLIFTRALAEETLRMYPPVPILGRQALDNATVGGKKIKRGSVVVVCPYMLHRNPKVFSRPDRFIPERFDERLAPRPQKYSYVPFAIGPRICPGLVFGLTEVVVALSILGSFLDPALEKGHAIKPLARLTLRPGATLPMVLKLRKPLQTSEMNTFGEAGVNVQIVH